MRGRASMTVPQLRVVPLRLDPARPRCSIRIRTTARRTPRETKKGGTHGTLAGCHLVRCHEPGDTLASVGAAGNPHLAHHHDALPAADGDRAREVARATRRAGRHPEPESLLP